MDFRQNPQTAVRPVTPTASSEMNSAATRRSGGGDDNKWLRILSAIVLIGVALLLAALALFFTSSRTGSKESAQINASKYQAVFLNNGQVYFGKIQALTSQYVQLSDIYYLTQNTTTGSNGQSEANGNYTLVKLGCQQIHDPYDQMMINRSQVTFWENLQDSGSVVTKINEFKKTYPNGPDCSQQPSSQTQASTGANTQNATNPSSKQ